CVFVTDWTTTTAYTTAITSNRRPRRHSSIKYCPHHG
ncbi:MAG: ribosomal protein L33, partial [Bacillariaceae sp.]